MQRQALWNRLYLSGIDGRAADLARENGLGLEIAAFCYAPNLEDPAVLSAVRAERASRAGRPSAATARQVRSFTRPVSRSRKSPIFPSFGQGKSPHCPQWSSPFSRTQRWTLQGTV